MTPPYQNMISFHETEHDQLWGGQDHQAQQAQIIVSVRNQQTYLRIKQYWLDFLWGIYHVIIPLAIFVAVSSMREECLGINAELEVVKAESNRVLMELESTMERIQYLEFKLAAEEEVMGEYKRKLISAGGSVVLLEGTVTNSVNSAGGSVVQFAAGDFASSLLSSDVNDRS
eukprot:CAMPEP_0116040514 /NCGR_PEP_ID=MMETSP0321-20121206/24409_1 /TAXON_ID=163516 /ORGANISM="Leptocylindrus danicus var. danicus, Strain B650" /LENGTH=171 /DNA_ID=CAMNT_0003520353 /DNA_START=162 /DNA_END=677 /DNA_ORIENTATION=-